MNKHILAIVRIMVVASAAIIMFKLACMVIVSSNDFMDMWNNEWVVFFSILFSLFCVFYVETGIQKDKQKAAEKDSTIASYENRIQNLINKNQELRVDLEAAKKRLDEHI